MNIYIFLNGMYNKQKKKRKKREVFFKFYFELNQLPLVKLLVDF
jgi:hypothetical protein